MSIKIKLKTKYNVMRIDNYYIESSSNLSNIKQQIKKAMKTKPNFINDAKMEAEVKINSNLIEFNINLVSLLLSIAAFYISIFEPIKLEQSVVSYLLFLVCLVFVLWQNILQHNQKEVAIRIKFAIEELEKEMQMSKQ